MTAVSGSMATEMAEQEASPRLGLDMDRIGQASALDADGEPVFEVEDLNVFYGDFHAVQGASFTVYEHEITAMIGPSGCGKTTVLRCFNRMNDLIPIARV